MKKYWKCPALKILLGAISMLGCLEIHSCCLQAKTIGEETRTHSEKTETSIGETKSRWCINIISKIALLLSVEVFVGVTVTFLKQVPAQLALYKGSGGLLGGNLGEGNASSILFATIRSQIDDEALATMPAMPAGWQAGGEEAKVKREKKSNSAGKFWKEKNV